MTRHLFAAALLTTLAAPVVAQAAPEGGAEGEVTILVSCYRGPLKVVAWDRPTLTFIDSLVAAGYSYGDAAAIGDRICRDEALVDDPDAIKAEMRRIHAATR